MTSETASWLLGLVDQQTIRCDHPDLMSIAKTVAVARAELVALIGEQTEEDQRE